MISSFFTERGRSSSIDRRREFAGVHGASQETGRVVHSIKAALVVTSRQPLKHLFDEFKTIYCFLHSVFVIYVYVMKIAMENFCKGPNWDLTFYSIVLKK